MGDRRERDRDRERERGPPERINSFFVVDTGFVEPDRNTCFEFQRTGRCTKGEACRFTHSAPPTAKEPYGTGGGAGAATKPWLTAGAATLVRGADGALELRTEGGAAAEAGPAAAAGGKKRKEKDDKKDKKERKRRKKEEKKRRKDAKRRDKDRDGKRDKKRRSRSGSSSSSSSSDSGEGAERGRAKRDDADAPPDASFPIAPIGEDDYFLKNHELSAWLRATRGVFFTSLSAADARAAFRDFTQLWNTRQLPRRLYEGVQVSGRR